MNELEMMLCINNLASALNQEKEDDVYKLVNDLNTSPELCNYNTFRIDRILQDTREFSSHSEKYLDLYKYIVSNLDLYTDEIRCKKIFEIEVHKLFYIQDEKELKERFIELLSKNDLSTCLTIESTSRILELSKLYDFIFEILNEHYK